MTLSEQVAALEKQAEQVTILEQKLKTETQNAITWQQKWYSIDAAYSRRIKELQADLEVAYRCAGTAIYIAAGLSFAIGIIFSTVFLK